MKKQSKPLKKKDKTTLTPGKKKDQFLDFLEKEIGIPNEILSELDIPENKIKKIEKFISVQISSKKISSPYPPPELLADYEKNKPGFTDKVIEYIDKNMEHRFNVDKHKMEIENKSISLDKIYLESNISKTRRSQWFAFIIAITGIGGAIVCALLKLEVLGAALVGFPLASIISHFLVGRKSKEKREDKKD